MSATLTFHKVKESLISCEELLELETNKQQLHIGVPAETDSYEYRIALTPETVDILVRNGHIVKIEKQAGAGSKFSDVQYSNAGAYIVERSEVFRADVLFKINPPTISEIDMMKERQLIFSFLPVIQISGTHLRKLSGKNITAIALDHIKDKSGGYPLLKILGEIAGTVAVQVASEYLSISSGGRGVLLGGITGVNPAEVVVIGSGSAAEFAIRSALGLGACVRVFDNMVQNLQLLQDKMGIRLNTSVIHPRALANADAVIGAAYIDGYQYQYVINEEMVMQMKKGSVIVDLSINQGGCCETSEMRTFASPTVIKHGVLHYCVPNITARVPQTASTAISNILANITQSMEQHKNIAIWFHTDPCIRNGVYMYNGILTSSYLGNLFNMPFQDIHLLMAAF